MSIDFTNYLSFEEFSDNKILIKCPEDENFSWRDFAETINTTLLKENQSPEITLERIHNFNKSKNCNEWLYQDRTVRRLVF